jgi:hypothetical protein
MTCASCGTELEPRTGPGRPAVYCSDGCRRFAEYKLRSLSRRIDKLEIELRELKAGDGYYDDDERRLRIRSVRRWIKQDSAELRALLGGNNQNASPEISK